MDKPEQGLPSVEYRLKVIEMIQSIQESLLAISYALVPGKTLTLEDYTKITDSLNASRILVRTELDDIRLAIDKGRLNDGK